MVKHIILWTLNPELSEEEKNEVKKGIKEGLEGLKGKVPGLTDVVVNISGRLASSNCDVMLDSTLESAEVGNLYTPEAFEKMRELGFRSLLARFGEQGTAELPLEKKFRRISTEQELEQALSRFVSAFDDESATLRAIREKYPPHKLEEAVLLLQ